MKILDSEKDCKKEQVILNFQSIINSLYNTFGDFAFINPDVSQIYNPALVESLTFFVISQSNTFLSENSSKINEVFHSKLRDDKKFVIITNYLQNRQESVDCIQHLSQRVTYPQSVFLESLK